MRRMQRGLLLLLVLLAAAGPAHAADRTTVVVTLEEPPLAYQSAGSRVLSAAARRAPLDVASASSEAYVAALRRHQDAVLARIPHAQVGWRYGVVLNGFSVTVPSAEVARIARIPGVAAVYPSTTYRSKLDRSVALIGAPVIWNADRSTAGQGMKIAILDDGIDPAHPFFSGAGVTIPPGYPRGNTQFTTGKIIVARAFAPKTPAWKSAALPFDPELSEHGTHVAGIAAGAAGSQALDGRVISGVAPAALLGNYKVLTVPTDADVGLDGNAPEIAAAVEAAVADGMNVINLSIGEPEVEPTRDLVARALEGAAAAGVVSVVAAGNDFPEFGAGSVGSPGSTSAAITVAAATKSRDISSFSSGGPTPISLRMKPEVAAPGSSILSSIPRADGLWTTFSGTSMAAPHVAGAAALLKQRHPAWTPAQIKSALALTGDPIRGVAATRQGGGIIDLPRADNPFVFAAPATVSFGLVAEGASAARSVDLTDAGGGGGPWTVTVEQADGEPSFVPSVPPSVTVPGRLDVSLAAAAGAPSTRRSSSGWIVLTRGADVRRIAWFGRVASPPLAEPVARLARTGTYRGTTRGRASLVTRYVYPEGGEGVEVPTTLTGPEAVYRVVITQPVENFGVVRLSGNAVPRVVAGGSPDRLTGYAALPLNLNPYLRTFLDEQPVSGAALPAPGSYDIVFDTPTPSLAGPFSFRFWLNDTAPPKLRAVARTVRRGAPLAVTAADGGSGVDPRSIHATVDGSQWDDVRFAGGRVSIRTRGLRAGRHTLVLQVSDYQETKNNENQSRILPNTARLRVSFRVR
jgi:subtilisin family serine protease